MLEKLSSEVLDFYIAKHIDNEVLLQYYRLQKSYEGTIELVKEDGVLYGKTSGTGLPLEDEKEKLSEIIQKLNERLGTNFTEMDKVLSSLCRTWQATRKWFFEPKIRSISLK